MFVELFSGLGKGAILVNDLELTGKFIDAQMAFNIATIASFLFYVYMWIMRENIRGSSKNNNSFVNQPLNNQFLLGLFGLSMVTGISSASLFIYIQHEFSKLFLNGQVVTDEGTALQGNIATGLLGISSASTFFTVIPISWIFFRSVRSMDVNIKRK
jgi:hypothetical protein